MKRTPQRGWVSVAILIGMTAGPGQAWGEVFSRHVVVAQEGHASDVGRDVLRAGGNAVDAAVATALALAVTLPEAGNLGGGGFLVAYLASSREVVTVDFRELAPALARPRMYLDREGKLRPRHRAGAWAAGVPGTVRGLGLAQQRWGRLRWEDVVRPAVRLAREGFVISADLAASLNDQLAPRVSTKFDSPDARLADFPSSVAVFSRPDGAPWKAGDRFLQPDLAATLQRIAQEGPKEFYQGRTAELIVRSMECNDGLIGPDDLANYEAKCRPPVQTTFRGYEVFGMGPPSSGGVVVCQMLKILERYDLKADGRDTPRTLHRVTEAMRRGFFTRATLLADPDFVGIPVAELVSKEHADQLAQTIGEQATPSRVLAPFPIVGAESDHTTHLSTLDEAGNAVALTYTLEESYGSKLVVEGAGFLLNNEMGDFNLIPGLTDAEGRIGTEPNQIAPGKRMLSSQSPTVVLHQGRVCVVTGSPGGRTIPNTTLWILLNLLEFGLEPPAAIAAGRTHHQWFPDVLLVERGAFPTTTLTALEALGHRWRTIERQGNANTIVVETKTGRLHGVPDPRRPTTKASGD